MQVKSKHIQPQNISAHATSKMKVKFLKNEDFYRLKRRVLSEDFFIRE